MFNLQGSEIIVILLLALVILGPEKLPDAIRKFAQTYGELKKMGNGFQSELKSVLDEPIREMKETARLVQDAADPNKIAAQAAEESALREAAKSDDQAAMADVPISEAALEATDPAYDGTVPAAEVQTGTSDEPDDGPPVTINQIAAANARGPIVPTAPLDAVDTVTDLADHPLTAVDAVTDDAEAGVDDALTLTEHLAELRTRIIRAALAVLIGMVVIIALYDHVLGFLLQPYRDLCNSRGRDFCDADGLFITGPTEGLATRIRVGMYGGIIAALPIILWQIWRFVVPALHAKERKYAVPFVLSSVLLFAAGGSLAYFTVGRALEFLISWAGEDVDEIFTVGSYISLIGLMIFAFGIGFLLPVLFVFLQLVNVVSPRTLLKSWRYATIGVFVLAAVITPSGDPVTLMMLALPMLFLYFVAILVGWLVLRKRPTV